MNHDVIITCALTGAGDTSAKSPHVPVTPKQIAAAAIEAAKAGATVVHCHVRDPQTGKFSRDVALYREVMERIREADVAVDHRGPGLRRLDGSGGDLFRGDRYVRALGGRVASTGECAGDDDVVVHGADSFRRGKSLRSRLALRRWITVIQLLVSFRLSAAGLPSKVVTPSSQRCLSCG